LPDSIAEKVLVRVALNGGRTRIIGLSANGRGTERLLHFNDEEFNAPARPGCKQAGIRRRTT
jgi:hypothetical protein